MKIAKILILSRIMLKNSQTYLKTPVFVTPQDFSVMFGSFSTLCTKELNCIVYCRDIQKILLKFLWKCHCRKSVRFRSFCGPYFPAFGLNMERYSVPLRVQSECGKVRTRKTPNTDGFYAVLGLLKRTNLHYYIFT